MLLLFQASASEKKHAKFCFVFALLLFIGGTTVDARPPKLFRVTLKTVDGERIQGILYDVTDSTILYVANNEEAVEALRTGTATPFVVNISEIRHLTIRRRGFVARSVLTGIAVGLAAGSVAAIANPSNRDKTWGAAYQNTFRSVGIGLMFTTGWVAGTLPGLFPRVSLRFAEETSFRPSTRVHLRRYAFLPQRTKTQRIL